MRIFPALVLASTAAVLLAGCGRKSDVDDVPSVATLEADPILLSRVLGTCNETADATAPECINARAAVDRRSVADEAQRARRAEAGFEAARDARRRADEAARQAQEALQKRMNAYELPVEGAGDSPAPAPQPGP